MIGHWLYFKKCLNLVLQQIHRIGSHTVSHAVLRCLANVLSNACISAYETALTGTGEERGGAAQAWCKEASIQVLLDIRVLFDVLSGRDLDNEDIKVKQRESESEIEREKRRE